MLAASIVAHREEAIAKNLWGRANQSRRPAPSVSLIGSVLNRDVHAKKKRILKVQFDHKKSHTMPL